jgi:hypothetical protein
MSYSLDSEIGTIHLCRAVGENWPPYHVADAILHESIHAFLFRLEWIAPIFDRQDCGETRSPWSGKILDGRQFVHACFVWSALLQLWARLSAQAPDRAFALRDNLVCAAQGFLMTEVGAQATRDLRGLTQPFQFALIELEARSRAQLSAVMGVRKIGAP